MIGIIPSANNTYEVFGDFHSSDLVEGKLYYNDSKRLFYYSTKVKRSNPTTGYFPVWDGYNTYISNFSNEKYFDKDVVLPDVNNLAKSINNDVAKTVRYRQRLSDPGEKLKPPIDDEDNMFTQVIKGTICALELTKIEMIERSDDIPDRIIDSYYSALNKVTMMRMEKFHIWIDKILRCTYDLAVYKNGKKILSYSYAKDKIDSGIVKYNKIINKDDDPLKKIIKIIMVMENISKSSLKAEDIDDYTINNMMTIIHSNKLLSAQIFCRFMRMAGLSFVMNVYDQNNKVIFTYSE